jgi:hypothetical protein
VVPILTDADIFSGFGGHGIYIVSENGGFPDNWRVEWTRVTGCQDGIHVRGGDANNGCAYSGDFQGNRGWGVYDHSFLGCGWIECHTAENAMGPYYVNTVGETTLLNCYSEEDQPPSQFVAGNVFVLNGLHGAGFTPDSSYFGGGTYARMHSSSFYGRPTINSPYSGARAWSAGLFITAGNTVRPSNPNDYVYKALNSGTTGGSEPSFSFVVDSTIIDNGITWKNVGIEPTIKTQTTLQPETISYTLEVVQEGYPGGQDAYYPFTGPHPEVLRVRYSTDGKKTWIYFFPTRADYPYIFGASTHQIGHSDIHTMVAAGSNGVNLTPATITVVSTKDFASAGTLLIDSSDGIQQITHTGKTSTDFTGCASSPLPGHQTTGTLSIGGNVYQGGSGTYIFFVPYFYYIDNVWTGVTNGGLSTLFTAGSNDGTYSAYGWGHEPGTTANDPRADLGSPWRVVYNITSGRWEQKWANSVVSKEWVGSNSLPTPGMEVYDFGLWTGNDTLGFRRMGWYDGSETYANVNWKAGFYQPVSWFSPGDWFTNRSTTTNYPVAIRAYRKGGWAQSVYGFDTNWVAGMGARLGGTVYPSTPNGFVYRANTNGTSGKVEPVWPLTVGDTIRDNNVVWENIGTQDGFAGNPNTFEPIVPASYNLLTKDCSAGGILTFSFAEISHERYKLTGNPSADFIAIIGTGAADSWNRVVYNASSKNVTLKASVGDTGVVVLAGQALHLLNDGNNIIRVGV